MKRGRGILVFVGVGAMAAAALALALDPAGSAVLDRVLPASALAVLDKFGIAAGPGPGGELSQGSGASAADYLVDGADGLKAIGPVAARAGNAAVFISQIITGYTTGVGQDIPAEITTIRPIMGCALTPPQPSSRIGHVAAGPSGVDLAVMTYNDTHLAAEVQAFVNVYRETGSPEAYVEDRPAFETYDVAVTERGAPVYLVLENRAGARIWNIHPAAGVQIERVILLGGAQAGVANLDPLVPVEVILGDGLLACGVQPVYPLNRGHQFLQAMESGAVASGEVAAGLAELAAAEAGYDIWFRDQFGVGAAESRIGWDAGTIALVGPVPDRADPKPVFAPIRGARIRLTQDKFFEISGQGTAGADFASRVRAIATVFAFGDLKTLRQGVAF